MPSTVQADAAADKLQRLLGYLKEDPKNSALILEAAETAFEAKDAAMAQLLADRLRAAGPVSPAQLGRLGFAALSAGAFGDAAGFYQEILEAGEADAPARFNLAYANAKEGRFDTALELLDEATATSLPQAATLEVQLLHERGEFEHAFDRARQHLTAFPDDRSLLAATSTLALDNEDIAFARTCARKAGDHPEALSSLGIIMLGEADTSGALQLFERSLKMNDAAPRSWIGQGLVRLACGEAAPAAQDIDRGAELFDDHIGSWLAAGWAYLVAGDLPAARARFERAQSIDPAFAETLGSIAVIDVADGRLDEARHRSVAALRLDRECFTALLAQSLLKAEAGDQQNAKAIFEQIIRTPIGRNELTVRDMLMKLGLGRN